MSRSEHCPTRPRKCSTISDGAIAVCVLPAEGRSQGGPSEGNFCGILHDFLGRHGGGRAVCDGRRRRHRRGFRRRGGAGRAVIGHGVCRGPPEHRPKRRGLRAWPICGNPFCLAFASPPSFLLSLLYSRTHFCPISRTLNLAGNATLRFPRHAVGQPSYSRHPHDFATRHSHPYRLEGEAPCSPS